MFKYLWVVFSFVLLFLSNAYAQDLTFENIETEISQIEQNTSVPDDIQLVVTEQIERIKSLIMSANEGRERVAAYKKTALNSERILAELSSQERGGDSDMSLIADQSTVTIGDKNALLRTEQEALSKTLSELVSRQTEFDSRAALIADEIVKTQKSISSYQEQLSGVPPLKTDSVKRINYLLNQTHLLHQTSMLDDLRVELSTIPARKAIVDARVGVNQKRLSQINDRIQSIGRSVANSRMEFANKLVQEAKENILNFSDPPKDTDFLNEDLKLATLLQSMEKKNFELDAAIAQSAYSIDKLKKSSRIVDRVIDAGSLSDDVTQLLYSVRDGLPRSQDLQQKVIENERLHVALQLNTVLWESQLDNLEIDTSLRFRVLHELIKNGDIQSSKFAEQKIVLQEHIAITNELSALLDRRLLWLPTNERISGQFFNNFTKGLIWIFNPTSWQIAIKSWFESINQNRILFVICTFLILIMFSYLPTLRRVRMSLASRVGDIKRDGYWVTPTAFLISLLLTLPISFLFFCVGAFFLSGEEPTGFSKSISVTLMGLSGVVFFLNIFRIMSQKEGLFRKHFYWSDGAQELLHYHVTWFLWFQAIAFTSFTLVFTSDVSPLRYGVGLVAFTASCITMAIMGYAIFWPNKGIAAQVLTGNISTKFLYLVCPIIIAVPLLTALMPVFGFFDTGMIIHEKIYASGYHVLAATVVFGLLSRIHWVARARRRARNQTALKIEQKSIKFEAARNAASGTATPKLENDLEIAYVKAEKDMYFVLFFIASLYLAVRLWIIWSPMIPALGVADEIVFWKGLRTVDGVRVEYDVTLARLFFSAAVIFGGFLAAQYVRRLMNISIFNRLNVEAGTRFAAGTLIGYVFATLGLVLGLAQLGLDWSKLQWIVAALGVGLGFGLQEIVANFISGLIILFERPVRVGDFVTIGTLSGTVSNIQVRAVTITDFDNREVLLPNKTIITENVMNWTLRDNVIRVTIKIGVAYGSDIAHVKQLIITIAKNHKDVLQRPPPTVFFLNHGESSLDFSLYFFVDNPVKRFPVTHDINYQLNQALKDHGIEIPFPQRDVHIKNDSEKLSQK